MKTISAPYATTLKGVEYIVSGNYALNTATGESLELATFMLAFQREQTRDKRFSVDPIVLGEEEINDLIPSIQASEYISETVTREHEGKEGFFSVTCKVIIWRDEEDTPNMLVSELEKKTVEGADLLAFIEPSTKLYSGLCNSMLYWSDEIENTLHYLGFENLQAGLWFNQKSETIARTGEYNFFKKASHARPVATKTGKARASLLNL